MHRTSAREFGFTCRQYDARRAHEMGLVNDDVPLAELVHSPLALRCLKSAFNADCDGQVGLQELASNSTLLYYTSEEGSADHRAYLKKRKPDFTKFPRLP